MILQNKGKQYNRLPQTKVPGNKVAFYCSTKLDGAYIQIHINKEEGTVRFYTSGYKEFHLEKAARAFIHATKHLTRNIIILEAEYTYDCLGKHGDRKNSAKITTYRTNFSKGITTVGCSRDLFNVFDIIDLKEQFNKRLEYLRALNECTNISVVKHTMMPYGEAMLLAKDKVLDGWEGLMLKSPSHRYQPGKRTNDVIKLKFPPRIEAVVVREIEGQGRLEGMIGALECRTEDGHTFNVGSGFTDKERMLWNSYKDTTITVEYESMNSGVPQQPTYKKD